MKNLINKLINLFGYKIIKVSSIDKSDLNQITRILIQNPEPIIFDVGANKGQSIERYKKLFSKPEIHSFEPNPVEVNNMKEKYKNEKKIFLNNCAVGEKEGKMDFNIMADSTHSSFKNLIPDTTWLKKRSLTAKVQPKEYRTKKVSTNLISLDDYSEKNNIQNIDILKIDTQGYEDKVLLGAEKLIKNRRIKLIQLEIIFTEIYEKPLQIYDIEKTLIPNKYKFFGTSNGGSLVSEYVYQSDFIYVSPDVYENFRLNVAV